VIDHFRTLNSGRWCRSHFIISCVPHVLITNCGKLDTWDVLITSGGITFISSFGKLASWFNTQRQHADFIKRKHSGAVESISTVLLIFV
jgi:hypothetical protein